MPVRGTLSNLKAKRLLGFRSKWPLEKGYPEGTGRHCAIARPGHWWRPYPGRPRGRPFHFKGKGRRTKPKVRAQPNRQGMGTYFKARQADHADDDRAGVAAGNSPHQGTPKKRQHPQWRPHKRR